MKKLASKFTSLFFVFFVISLSLSFANETRKEVDKLEFLIAPPTGWKAEEVKRAKEGTNDLLLIRNMQKEKARYVFSILGSGGQHNFALYNGVKQFSNRKIQGRLASLQKRSDTDGRIVLLLRSNPKWPIMIAVDFYNTSALDLERYLELIDLSGIESYLLRYQK